MRVFMFPGQSSISESMSRRAAELGTWDELEQEASAVVGETWARRFFESEAFEAQSNRDVQLGVFLTNHLQWLALQRFGCSAEWSLGLSLGEFNHLVDIGALSFVDALRLVDERGKLYDEGPEGVMVAVNGVDGVTVDAVLTADASGVCISNYNGPTQHVIAGKRPDVERVVQVLEDEHFAMTREIESRIPMHCPLFEPVAHRFAEVVRNVAWQPPCKPYFPNVVGAPILAPTADDFIRSLVAHVHRPVQWQRSITWIAQNVESPTLVEVGPGRVLSNLARRGWPDIECHHMDGEPPRSHFESTAVKVRDAA